MKKKILIFVCGIVVGVIITTVGFLIYGKTIDKNSRDRMPMNQNGELVQPEDIGERPELPDGEVKGKNPQFSNTVN